MLLEAKQKESYSLSNSSLALFLKLCNFGVSQMSVFLNELCAHSCIEHIASYLKRFPSVAFFIRRSTEISEAKLGILCGELGIRMLSVFLAHLVILICIGQDLIRLGKSLDFALGEEKCGVSSSAQGG